MREGTGTGAGKGKGKGKGKGRGDARVKKPFRKRKRRPCLLCEGKGADYKNIAFVRRFISDRGKILPTRSTGCCTKHQRIVSKVVKRARQAGLIPYSVD
ncbi:MAG: 30S ribosomal protein S18 [Candidatus Saganbacteria bacterium]|nr:30S ribosomal protein S18 [Candidatus Saganbacteria bacterium]